MAFVAQSGLERILTVSQVDLCILNIFREINSSGWLAE